jgi:hypothetical protein
MNKLMNKVAIFTAVLYLALLAKIIFVLTGGEL